MAALVVAAAFGAPLTPETYEEDLPEIQRMLRKLGASDAGESMFHMSARAAGGAEAPHWDDDMDSHRRLFDEAITEVVESLDAYPPDAVRAKMGRLLRDRVTMLGWKRVDSGVSPDPDAGFKLHFAASADELVPLLRRDACNFGSLLTKLNELGVGWKVMAVDLVEELEAVGPNSKNYPQRGKTFTIYPPADDSAAGRRVLATAAPLEPARCPPLARLLRLCPNAASALRLAVLVAEHLSATRGCEAFLPGAPAAFVPPFDTPLEPRLMRHQLQRWLPSQGLAPAELEAAQAAYAALYGRLGTEEAAQGEAWRRVTLRYGQHRERLLANTAFAGLMPIHDRLGNPELVGAQHSILDAEAFECAADSRRIDTFWPAAADEGATWRLSVSAEATKVHRAWLHEGGLLPDEGADEGADGGAAKGAAVAPDHARFYRPSLGGAAALLDARAPRSARGVRGGIAYGVAAWTTDDLVARLRHELDEDAREAQLATPRRRGGGSAEVPPRGAPLVEPPLDKGSVRTGGFEEIEELISDDELEDFPTGVPTTEPPAWTRNKDIWGEELE